MTDPPPPSHAEALALEHRDGWPPELRLLLARYPREEWHNHANLGDMARFWLSRHAMFRELADLVQRVAQGFDAGEIAPTRFPGLIMPRLQFLLRQLALHHQIEDLHYFPLFRAAEARLARGFDVLEQDHHAIHAYMARVAETANALLHALAGADIARHARCGADHAAASRALIRGLLRHLDDEEDLIVPLILDRGEAALGVAHP
ncbi:MAG: hemerythrin domain-containing protein [Pseudolabrys sp.]|nr:hemerythrin domain-containing protein [Pseudolabrys sp.]